MMPTKNSKRMKRKKIMPKSIIVKHSLSNADTKVIITASKGHRVSSSVPGIVIATNGAQAKAPRMRVMEVETKKERERTIREYDKEREKLLKSIGG